MDELRSIEILFKDDDMVVVRKPPGMPCQPDKTGAEDAVSALSKSLGGYIGLVHRLDRPVGGVMAFARNPAANAKMSQQAHEGLGKTYLAVVVSDEKPLEAAELRHFLVKNEHLNMSFVADGPHIKDVKEAVLRYEPAASAPDRDGKLVHLLKINLLTGRHHQIRVQLASAGMPIWGDTKYGPKQRRRHGAILALWALRLSLRHPRNRHNMEFETFPDELYPFTLFKLK
ncbi:MAG: RluA family pseudouridine synthase [Defluviitaleaceae bacterium]|nr:RluA family pseudouridine synthase [Defluviitaleaceae bacterium]